MPRISEQLQQALTEGFKDNADFMRTLNTIAKQGGTWKSEKQARFILDTVDGSRWEASPPAQKWAKANRMGGEYLAFADQRIQGFGRSTASKIRLTGRLYALDGGGVVSIAKVPYQHQTQSSQGFQPDWDRTEIVFRRTKKPSIVVDPRGERAAAAKKNAPMIAKLKMIPNWEEKDIIVSFIGQLEAGGKLSVKQMGIVNNMLPPELVERGDVQHWKEQYAKFQDLLAKKVLPAIAQARRQEEIERIKRYKETIEAGKRWNESVPELKTIESYYESPIKQIRSQGYADTYTVVQNILQELANITRSKIGFITVGIDASEGLHKQLLRAFKPKPTKKSLTALDFVLRAVKVMESKPVQYWIDANL